MNSKTNQQSKGHFLLFLCTCIIVLLFVRLYNNIQPYLDHTEQQYREGKALQLQPGVSASSIRSVLSTGDYYNDQRDIDLVADSLAYKLVLAGKLPNLGTLNKQAFTITAPATWQINTGGPDLKDRFHASLTRLGFDSASYVQESTAPPAYPSVVNAGNGTESISGSVKADGQPMSAVLIQLKQHIAVTDTTIEWLAYARTDAAGRFTFQGLYKDSGYSVLPLKPGYEFGARKGTPQLSKAESYSFRASPHSIRLFGTIIFGQIKDDKLFTVRTPQEFKTSFWMIAAGFILSFWIVHIFWWVRRFPVDTFLLPALMMLTGISVVTLLSLQDALQDTLHAWDALIGVIAGMAGLVIFSQINFGRIYASWWFDWLFNFKKKSFYNLQGWTWLVLAAAMAIITLLIGTGPEGSGVKVNLRFAGLTFQPSEITKYLLLLFFAAFFAANEQKLRSFQDMGWRFIVSWTVMAGTCIVLVLYLLMGDMGPAIVVCLTFLVFYSIARGNLGITVISGMLYGILLWLLPELIATLIIFVAVLIFLLAKKQVRSSRWYGWIAVLAEAPVLLLIILAAFTFGDKLPVVGDRLADRKAMWLHQWNNDIYGGDHLAHGYWTLSSGGLSGQGLGKGYANTMPAAHTDMILPSIGEELGWLGLVSIFLLFGLLIHRMFLHAKRAGQPFSFYLCAGIAVATGLQFLLIAGGSIGLFPLTGVTVPFLSYGKISLIINLAAMGIIASVSARPGKEVQKEYIQKYYDPVLLTGIAGFLAGVLILAGKLAMIQLWGGKEYIVKTARVIDRNGQPAYSYNPRIYELAKLIGAGNIYDRNKLLLATSDPAWIKTTRDSLEKAGLDNARLEDLTHKKLRRYYPFGEHMFFWVGDFNTRLFWNQGNGYFAEAQHLSTLRGFDTDPIKLQYVTSKYRQDRFTKPVQRSVELIGYDYSALANMLRTGIDSNNKEVQKLTHKNRDVQLSTDAKLQTALQQKIAVSAYRDKRVSVVVMDAGTGDVLASAIHPLPDLQSPENMLLSDNERNKLPMPVTERDLGMTYPTAPGSTAKIVTAMAAFRKMGNEATKVSYDHITTEESIRDEEPTGFINMHTAITRSSNVYFIRLANDYTLDDDMSELYFTSGMSVGFKGGYYYSPAYTPLQKREIINSWKTTIFNVNRNFYKDEKRSQRSRYNSEFSGLAWGQGQLTATPASMARIAALIANKGDFRPPHYILSKEGKPQPIDSAIRIVNDDGCVTKLEQFMIDQSTPGGRPNIEGIKVAGKTGTPQRNIARINSKGKTYAEKRQDGWYVFYAPTPDKRSHTVVCIRIELGDKSLNAVALAKEIAPILKEMGYLDSF